MNKNTPPLTISKFKERKAILLKRKELNLSEIRNLRSVTQRFEEELYHAQYFLCKYGGESAPNKKATTKEIVLIILRENGNPMKSKEIYRELYKHGTEIQRGTFNVNMFHWSKSQEVPIKRIRNGVYSFDSI